MELPDDIDICQIVYDDSLARKWNIILSHEEQQRLLDFPLPKRQREFMLGRIAARTLVGRRMSLDPQSVPLRVASDGAIDVLQSNLVLSIAHSGDRAVAVVAERTVGVDIEEVKQRNPRLMQYILHPDEYRHFAMLPLDSDHKLVLAWTIKEAILKAKRTGLRVSPKNLKMEVDLYHRQADVVDRAGQRWQARFENRDAFYLAVAFE